MLNTWNIILVVRYEDSIEMPSKFQNWRIHLFILFFLFFFKTFYYVHIQNNIQNNRRGKKLHNYSTGQKKPNRERVTGTLRERKGERLGNAKGTLRERKKQAFQFRGNAFLGTRSRSPEIPVRNAFPFAAR